MVDGLRYSETAGFAASDRVAGSAVIASDACLLADLYRALPTSSAGVAALTVGSGWVRRWKASWRVDGDEVVSTVDGLSSLPISACGPVRRFTWRARQRHRPGLQYVVSTDRHHGFESIAEQRLLLALDFAGARAVVSQPFRLRYVTRDGWRQHVPDFLALVPDGVWLFDVRPAGRVKPEDEVAFAAAAEAALAAGWGYAVVTGWRPQAMTTVDTLSAQRRPLTDPLGLRPRLLDLAAAGHRSFGALADATPCPAVARAQLLHLLWRRELGVDLAQPLDDRSGVWPAGGGGS